MDKILSTVPQLLGKENYREWALAIKGAAYWGGFWIHYENAEVLNTISRTEADAIAASDETKSKVTQDIELVKAEMKAQGALLMTVTMVIKLDLDGLKHPDDTEKPATAYDMWARLKSKYETRDGVSALLDYKKFIHATLVDDGTLEDQLNRHLELRSRCATNDFLVPDWQYATLILLALPDSYSHVQETFLTTGTVKDLKPDEVRSRILETEIRRKENGSSAYSLSTQTPATGKKNAATSSSSSSALSAVDKSNVECFYCNKKGHMANECRKKIRDKKKKKKKENATSGSAKPNAASNSALNAVASDDEYDASPLCAYFGAPERWLVDSGATDHMTPFGSDITDFISFAPAQRTVTLGNSRTTCNILGKGTVTRWVETSPRHYRQIILENVLLVEGIKRRFLSTVQFQDRDYIISLEKNRAVFSKENKLLFSAPRNDRLLECILYSEKPLGRYSLNVVSELPIKLWHERMGHLNWEALKNSQSKSSSPIIGIRFDDTEPPHSTCEGCVAGKAKRRSFKSSTSGHRATLPIKRIHSDLMGPMEIRSVVGGFEYVCVFTCCCSRHVWVYLLKAKSQTFSVFKGFRTMIEKQLSRHIKYFRTDRGGEFMSAEFTAYLEEQGIVHETSAPRTPQQNGVAERMNQTLLGGARAMLHHAGMTYGFWSEAIHVAAHVLNRAPRSGLGWKTPYELLFGHKPEVSHLRVFGCRAWAINEQAKKWDPRSTPMVFVGYEIASKAYRLWDPTSRRIVVSTNVKFDESILPNKPTPTPQVPTPANPIPSSSKLPPPTVSVPWFFDDVEEPKSKPPPASTDKGKQRADPPSPPDPPTLPHRTPSPDLPDSPEQPPPSTPPDQGTSRLPPSAPSKPTRPRRNVKAVEKYVAGTSGLGSAETEGERNSIAKFEETYCHMVEAYASVTFPNEPRTFEDAKSSDDSSKWGLAMKEEIDTLESRGTWETTDRPANKPVVSCKWVYRLKTNSAGEVIRHKARLVARGFSQTYGVDYKETFAPVTRLETLRLMFALAVERNWEIRQVDVKNAYLYGDLDEEIYMEAPLGMDVPKGKVLRLRKALYGLKQAGRAWYHKLKSVMKEFGLTQVPCEPHLFVTQKIVGKKKLTLILPIYVDDLFPIGDKHLTDQFEEWIGKYFDVSILGDASYFLGIRVTRDRTAEPPSLTLDQGTYVTTMLTKHRIDTTKESKYPVSTLSATYVERHEDEPAATREEIRRYQSFIGSLMYLMLGTRPDIAYAVGRFARFAHDPSKDHFKAVGRIFAYVNATKGFALKYTKTMDDSDIYPYGTCDADFAGELAKEHKRKSTSGNVFFTANGPFSWSSKLQPVIATSTTEAEYIALYTAAKQAVWIRQIFEAVGVPFDEALDLWCDNKSAISTAHQEGTHEAKKHIDVKYHYVQELVTDDKIDVKHINTGDNEADILTKCLTGESFTHALELLQLENVEDFISSMTPASSSSDTPNPDTSSISLYVDAHE